MSKGDEILDNMKFRQVMKDNKLSNPWLFNYELGDAEIPEEEGGGRGTVYSSHGQTGENEYTVIPTIIANDRGKLEFRKDFKEIANERDWGVKFPTEKEALDFSKWLSKYHEKIGQTDSNYEL